MSKIFLLGFRGTGGFHDPYYAKEPALIKAGHVGIQLEGDDRIFGFHPTQQAEQEAGGENALIELLSEHIPQDACVQIDNAIFERAYQLSLEGARTKVWMLIYEVTIGEFETIQTELYDWFENERIYQYNFPRRDGSFAHNECNCALFPKLLGIQVPSENGNLKYYIEAMSESAVEWQP